MVTHCNKTNYTDGDEGDDDGQRKRHTEREEAPIDESTAHTCYGIDFLVEDNRDIV